MIQIENTLVSFEIFQSHFVCDLAACKGACCVEGDSGAPLSKEETFILEEIEPLVRPYLPKSGQQAIAEQGAHIEDPYEVGSRSTPLVNKKECAYTVFSENGTAQCGIELAYRDGKMNFQKPLSCHLYPIRITQYPRFQSINYHKWGICQPACECGSKLQVPLYKFLKAPLIRAYGEEWYNALEIAADELKKNPKFF